MRESAVERYLTAAVKQNGGMSFKWSSPAMRGVPDRIVMFPGGKIYFIEVKTETGILSPLQVRCAKLLKDMGFFVSVVRSKSDVDFFISFAK